MLKAGIFLQNRYEIINRIGSGGMADVYKAKDHKLNRFVAVKVLKQEFKDDKVFLSKFRVEAQAAAGLAHTNIVNVYDVGEDGGISFIVMELVEGITLKSYISKKGKLSVREATSIALQVAAGLESAHNNGIVHRDVKPQNILISLDGKAKIADFGIARAANSNTISSNAMGSVHYSSPEQTRGGYSDAKSDIYSMGITMFEMLTGRVPFDGDSTVEVALRHLQEDIPSPRKFTPEIPFSTEQIVLKCTQKSPDRRYSNMTELIRDLKESLVNPGGNFVVIPTVDKSAHTVMLSKEEISQIKSGSMPAYDHSLNTGAAGDHKGTGTVSPESSRIYPYGGNYYQNSGYQDLRHNQDRQGSGSDYTPDAYDSPYHDRLEYPDDPYQEEDLSYPYDQDEYDQGDSGRRKRRKRDSEDGEVTGVERLLTVISIVAAVAVGLTVLFFAGRALGLFSGGTRQTETVPVTGSTEVSNTAGQVQVPRLLGRSEADAQKLLKDLELGYQYQGESPSNDYPKGQVVSQSVDEGSLVEKHTTIGYVLSSGSSQTKTVPDLSGREQSEAVDALSGMGLVPSVDTSRYSDTVQAGYVITTNPGAGSSVKAGDAVTIYVSQGAELTQVEVPDVRGKYASDADTLLTNYGLYTYITEVVSDTVEKGIVISQDIEPGTKVQSGSPVTITVSAGRADGDDIQILDGATGTWVCNAQLPLPAGESYNGEPVRVELVQNETSTIVYEGTTSFPFILNVTGQTGVQTGTVRIYIIDPETWEVKNTYVYEGITFSQTN